VRPEKIYVSFDVPSTQVNCFEGRLKHVRYLGTHVHYVVELLSGDGSADTKGDRLTVVQPSQVSSLPDAHAPIYVYWAATDCLALAA
jgi:spermidine/putrescine transport system ATP-binding protein